MVKIVYFDTSVWLAPYDPPYTRPNQAEEVASINRICNAHRKGALELVKSNAVLKELCNHLSQVEKQAKASRALKDIKELRIRLLPRAPTDIGKLALGGAQFGVPPKFEFIPKHPPDREVIEHATENNVDFFVSLDETHISGEDTRRELESMLSNQGTKVVMPSELVRILFPDET